MAAACGARPLTVSGVFNNSINDIVFDKVSVDVKHKRDIDQGEDGCIARVDITLSKGGTGCRLTVSAGSTLDDAETLAIQSVIFEADSQCPSFSDKDEGVYGLGAPSRGSGVRVGITEVPNRNSANACFNSTMTLSIEGDMRRQGQRGKMRVGSSVFKIRGDFKSKGESDFSCPCRPVVRYRPPPRPRRRVRRYTPPPALPPVQVAQPSKSAFELILGLGAQTCMESGSIECPDDSTSISGLIAMGSRVNKNFGVYLDTSFGALYPDRSGDTSTLTVMPTMRLIAPFTKGEFIASLGFGYSSIKSTEEIGYFDEEIEAVWQGFGNAKIGAGLVFKPELDGPTSLGVMLEYVFNSDGTGELCLDNDCEDNKNDMVDLLQFYFAYKGTY